MIFFVVFLPLIGFLFCAFFGKKFNDIVRFCRAKNKIGMPYDYIPDDIFKEHRVDHQLRILDFYFMKILMVIILNQLKNYWNKNQVLHIHKQINHMMTR